MAAAPPVVTERKNRIKEWSKRGIVAENPMCVCVCVCEKSGKKAKWEPNRNS